MSLQSLVDSDLPGTAPIVIIVSDAGVRGDAMDERMSAGGSGGGTGSWGKDVIDIRSVLPSGLLHSVYVTEIACVRISFTGWFLTRMGIQLQPNSPHTHA